MPIRIAVSPRAWMMKGDATWKAPSAAAPLIRVRRLNFGLKACVIMNYPPDRCVSWFKFYRHCEKRSDEAIHTSFCDSGLLRFARNDRFKFPCRSLRSGTRRHVVLVHA